MCELLAVCSRIPTTIEFSLERLARHGGIEGPHRDGWGVAFYAGRDVLLLREPGAAAQSELVRFIERHSPSSRLILSHIRLATQGEVSLANTQPFMREMGGYSHAFAHNGDLDDVGNQRYFQPRRFRPVGTTDSELVFCNLLDRLESHWSNAGRSPPPLAQRLDVISEFAARLRALGPANFLYADGDALFAHAHRRTQADGEIRPPGMHLLERSCHEACPELAASGVRLEATQQEVTLIASVPLTAEAWHPLGEGEIVVLRDGAIVERRAS